MDTISKIKEKISWFCNDRAHSTCWFDSCCGMDWGTCAEKHDRRYESTRLTKFQADKLLFRCVLRNSNIVMATIMFAGVVVFGQHNYNKAQEAIVK